MNLDTQAEPTPRAMPTIVAVTAWPPAHRRWWSICNHQRCGGLNTGPWPSRRKASQSSLKHLRAHHPDLLPKRRIRL